MPKFSKKPVVIDAVLWTGKNLQEVIAFIDGPPDVRSTHAGEKWEDYERIVAAHGLKIYTLEGKMSASVGDWIIKGVKGELYPCKPDIFEMTYEPLMAYDANGNLKHLGQSAPAAKVNKP
ncbi:hypothetical protein [Pseudomonas typographi]|uniref:hypothetical protein n=1 Tax=Pseudomonas typographi TaxID=2715964 RepID=UPI0019320DD6|nr:hypothetical protein [Pseudomonas typographi]